MITERLAAFTTLLVPMIGVPLAGVLTWGGFTRPIDVMLGVSLYVFSFLGITVGFHRLLTHRSFACRPWLRAVLTAAGCMAAQGPPLFWVAIHRKHHQDSDAPGDPHSPHAGDGWRQVAAGFWHAHVGWMLTRPRCSFLRYAPDVARDSAVMRVGKRYWWWVASGMVLPAVIGGLWSLSLGGAISGLVWGGLVRLLVAQHITWSINSLTHMIGSRPFRTDDMSRNLAILSVVSLGESWHNNHHAFPTSARHGLRWWQFDLSYQAIRWLERCGLAWDVRTPLPSQLAAIARS